MQTMVIFNTARGTPFTHGRILNHGCCKEGEKERLTLPTPNRCRFHLKKRVWCTRVQWAMRQSKVQNRHQSDEGAELAGHGAGLGLHKTARICMGLHGPAPEFVRARSTTAPHVPATPTCRSDLLPHTGMECLDGSQLERGNS